MVNLGSDEIIKYPFLDEAGKYLSDKGFSLEDFATNTDLKKIVENAFERITISLEGHIYKSDLTLNTASTTTETFSFLIAVILLKLAGMNTICVNRYNRELQSNLPPPDFDKGILFNTLESRD